METYLLGVLSRFENNILQYEKAYNDMRDIIYKITIQYPHITSWLLGNDDGVICQENIINDYKIFTEDILIKLRRVYNILKTTDENIIIDYNKRIIEKIKDIIDHKKPNKTSNDLVQPSINNVLDIFKKYKDVPVLNYLRILYKSNPKDFVLSYNAIITNYRDIIRDISKESNIRIPIEYFTKDYTTRINTSPDINLCFDYDSYESYIDKLELFRSTKDTLNMSLFTKDIIVYKFIDKNILEYFVSVLSKSEVSPLVLRLQKFVKDLMNNINGIIGVFGISDYVDDSISNNLILLSYYMPYFENKVMNTNFSIITNYNNYNIFLLTKEHNITSRLLRDKKIVLNISGSDDKIICGDDHFTNGIIQNIFNDMPNIHKIQFRYSKMIDNHRYYYLMDHCGDHMRCIKKGETCDKYITIMKDSIRLVLNNLRRFITSTNTKNEKTRDIYEFIIYINHDVLHLEIILDNNSGDKYHFNI